MDRSGHWISTAKRTAIVTMDSRVCAYCGIRCTTPRTWRKGGCKLRSTDATLDHVTPRTMGGSHAATNIVVCCNACNAAKGNLDLPGFAAYLTAMGVDGAVVQARVEARLRLHDAIEIGFGRRSRA